MQNTRASQKLRTLLQSEARFRTLVERSTDAIHLMDRTGRIIYSSDTTQAILGYAPEEALGARVLEHIHPDDIPLFSRRIAELMAKPGHQIVLEHRVRHKDGHWVWLESVGVNHLETPAIEAIVGGFRDITKRKMMEQALAESEARLRFMAESMPQKIFTTKGDGTIEYFNRQWSEYTGMSMDAMRTGGFSKFVHPQDARRSFQAWRHALESGEPFSIEHRFKRADGAYRWHLTRANAMRNETGEIVTWIGSTTDIDELKKAEQRQQRLEQRTALLTRQRQQLLELNRAKDEFISLASHQLRTPATGVKQFLGMILEGFTDETIPPGILKMIGVAYESNERQLRIVNDLLKVAYVDAGHLKLAKADCDAHELIQQVLMELKEVFGRRGQKVKYVNNVRNVKLQADSRLLRMVLENIIDNASKYSPDGTAVTVTVQRAAGFLCINVTDQGVGIGPKDQARLFKKFSRIDNPRSTQVGGTGLGLYWAQQVVALHRGSIMVRSAEGMGSTFSIQIPLPKG